MLTAIVVVACGGLLYYLLKTLPAEETLTETEALLRIPVSCNGRRVELKGKIFSATLNSRNEEVVLFRSTDNGVIRIKSTLSLPTRRLLHISGVWKLDEFAEGYLQIKSCSVS